MEGRSEQGFSKFAAESQCTLFPSPPPLQLTCVPPKDCQPHDTMCPEPRTLPGMCSRNSTNSCQKRVRKKGEQRRRGEGRRGRKEGRVGEGGRRKTGREEEGAEVWVTERDGSSRGQSLTLPVPPLHICPELSRSSTSGPLHMFFSLPGTD